MNNVPEVKPGIIAVSRDCFPAELSKKRRMALIDACQQKNLPVVELETIVENENDTINALQEIQEKQVNALVIFLGNFGPEGPTTLLAQRFEGPVMIAAAAEETKNDLFGGRGDAYCGMLNTSYNCGLRNLKPYIPEYPVGNAEEVAEMVQGYIPVARVMLGLKRLKIFSFGPRPQDFLACNAPIKPLYDLGVEIMENSELDMYDIFREAKDDPQINSIVEDMTKELGAGNQYPDMLSKLAQYEIALKKFMKSNLGASNYGIFANKCWPAFQKYFNFVPCYVHSRLAAEGIPVACEVDIYGALSEYIATCATQLPAAILDINNTVPYDMIQANKKAVKEYTANELFMGFHCGNTSASCLANHAMKHQLIMHRLMEPDKDPDITRGTLEGQIKAGKITIFRLQSTADTQLKSYMAQGEVLNVDPKSFGGIGVIGIKGMDRFYRHVLIEKRFPHHTAMAFDHAGKVFFEVCKMLGVTDISYPLPDTIYYDTENPFAGN